MSTSVLRLWRTCRQRGVELCGETSRVPLSFPVHVDEVDAERRGAVPRFGMGVAADARQETEIGREGERYPEGAPK